MLLAAFYMILFAGFYDIIILDQVSIPIPFLRLFTSSKIIYYCHFPDLLLSTNRKSCIMKFYRLFIDFLEQRTTGMAHKIFVNSKFTQRVFYATFKSLQKTKTEVLYPCIDLKQFKQVQFSKTQYFPEMQKKMKQNTLLITSLNRYQRKKNVRMVLEIAKLMNNSHPQFFTNQLVHFCIAGGYDQRLSENVEYYTELQNLATEIFAGEQKAQNHFTFLRSISNDQRKALLKQSSILLYTPANEHFGIVPLEGMYNGCLVLGCNSGGPTQTIIDGETGFLLEQNAEIWSKKLIEIVQDMSSGNTAALGAIRLDASEHVEDKFSFESFRKQLTEPLFEKAKQN